MAKFFSSQNNGVIAVIREDHAATFATVKKSGGDPFEAGVKVFTFCHKERLARQPEERIYFTGTYEFAQVLLEGHEVDHRSGGGWTGYVPFSNQEFEDTRYVTTAQDVVEIFGLVRTNN